MVNMNEQRDILLVLAYYLSEFDIDAVAALGFSTRSEALREISHWFGRYDNYLKFTRDEFDALPKSRSSRKGWLNRPPRPIIVSAAEDLNQYSFDELTEIVISLLHSEGSLQERQKILDLASDFVMSGIRVESIVNVKDYNATVVVREGYGKIRIYNKEIIRSLKKLYKGKCQICGVSPFDKTDLTEAHHIEYFIESQNNDSNNIMILCPNHHRYIHKLNPKFNFKTLCFELEGGETVSLKLNHHLCPE